MLHLSTSALAPIRLLSSKAQSTPSVVLERVACSRHCLSAAPSRVASRRQERTLAEADERAVSLSGWPSLPFASSAAATEFLPTFDIYVQRIGNKWFQSADAKGDKKHSGIEWCSSASVPSEQRHRTQLFFVTATPACSSSCSSPNVKNEHTAHAHHVLPPDVDRSFVPVLERLVVCLGRSFWYEANRCQSTVSSDHRHA